MDKVSRPEETLPVNNAKSRSNCTELHLGHKGITRLEGFHRLVNLEVLWINHNRISKLDNLDQNFRLRELYAHNNEIYTLKGSLPKLKFLRVLTLGNNRLSSLGTLLQTLRKCAYLEELDMHANPCAEEINYRYRLIYTFPTLKILDRHVITDVERYEAAKKFGKKPERKLQKSPSGSTMTRSRRLSIQYGVIEEKKESETAVQRMLKRDIREASRRQKREELRDIEKMLSQKEERQSLSRSISQTLPTSALGELVQNDDTITNKTIRKSMIERGALDGARPDGLSAMLTMRHGRPERLLSEAESKQDSNSSCIFSPMRSSATVKKSQAAFESCIELSAWDIYILKKMFKEVDNDKDGKITLDQLQYAFDKAIDYGITLENNESHEISTFIFDQCRVQYGDESTVPTKQLAWFIEPLCKQSKQLEGAVKFKALDARESGNQAQVYHHKVQKIYDQLGELRDDDPRKQVLQKQVFSSLQTFNRLQNIHERAAGKFDPAKAPHPQPKRRTDLVEFVSTVPLREAEKTLREDSKDYKIPPPGEESDSDSDQEDGMRIVGNRKFDEYRQRRKARKPKVVLTERKLL